MIGTIVLGALLAVSIGVFAWRVRLLYRLVRLGQPTDRFDDLPKRVGLEATVVLGQRKLLQRAVPGLMHAFIFWGFLMLLTTIVEAMGQIFSRTFRLPLIGGTTALTVVQDVFAALVLVGVATAFYIRKVQRPDRFDGSHLREADYILLWIAAIILTLFGIKSTSTGSTVHYAFLWGHVLLILGFTVRVRQDIDERHIRALMTTTSSRPSPCSSGPKTRPRIGCTPNNGHSAGDTAAP